MKDKQEITGKIADELMDFDVSDRIDILVCSLAALLSGWENSTSRAIAGTHMICRLSEAVAKAHELLEW